MYKLKEGVKLPKEFKIKVNKKQSEALQKYLFSIGKTWVLEENNKVVKNLEHPYLYIKGKTITYSNSVDIMFFKEHELHKIKFKDYFEKVKLITCKDMEYGDVYNDPKYLLNDLSKLDYLTSKTGFPEKWCILVTKDNYKELCNWVHKNKENYLGFDKYWFTFEKHSIGNYLYCEGDHRWDKGLEDVFYQKITTEQFREHFGFSATITPDNMGKGVKALFETDQIDWRQKCSSKIDSLIPKLRELINDL